MKKHTLDTKDIALLLSVSREHVTNRIVKHPDFPKPAINLSQRIRVWNADEVLAYFKKRQRAAPKVALQSAPQSHGSTHQAAAASLGAH